MERGRNGDPTDLGGQVLSRYVVLEGTSDPLSYDPECVVLFDPEAPDFAIEDLPGVWQRGHYNLLGEEGETVQLRVGYFRYHKMDNTGNPESFGRLVVITGQGAGVHPNHAGQEPSVYVIGSQVGTIDLETMQATLVSASNTTINPNNYSLDCMWGGQRGYNPVLAT